MYFSFASVDRTSTARTGVTETNAVETLPDMENTRAYAASRISEFVTNAFFATAVPIPVPLERSPPFIAMSVKETTRNAKSVINAREVSMRSRSRPCTTRRTALFSSRARSESQASRLNGTARYLA